MIEWNISGIRVLEIRDKNANILQQEKGDCKMTKVSVVVPVYNEEGNVAELHREIKEVCEKNQYEYEIIFVNDGAATGRPPSFP